MDPGEGRSTATFLVKMPEVGVEYKENESVIVRFCINYIWGLTKGILMIKIVSLYIGRSIYER